jgi:hypothetical protein
MKFNIEKCKIMHIGNKNRSKTDYFLTNNETQLREKLEITNGERDLGIFITSDLKWDKQANKAANKANFVLGSLKRTFTSWTIDSMRILYTTFVRPHLEYASSTWSPYRKLDIKILESVQRRATKLVPSLKNRSYEDRLLSLGLKTLEERRDRGDMINYFKCENGFNKLNWYHPNKKMYSLNQIGPSGGIRGQKHRLERQFTGNCHQRNNFFINRIIPKWNKCGCYKCKFNQYIQESL